MKNNVFNFQDAKRIQVTTDLGTTPLVGVKSVEVTESDTFFTNEADEAIAAFRNHRLLHWWVAE